MVMMENIQTVVTKTIDMLIFSKICQLFADEIGKQLRDSGAVGVVTVSDIYSSVSKAVNVIEAERKSKIPVIISPGLEDKAIPRGTINFQDMTHKDIDTSNLAADDRLSPDSVVVLPYSSGTTGLPKGVKLTHRHLVTNCLQVLSEPMIRGAEKATSEYNINLLFVVKNRDLFFSDSKIHTTNIRHNYNIHFPSCNLSSKRGLITLELKSSTVFYLIHGTQLVR
jgi:acyl-CoA synthetase (AMP-forming)/AMP-acid ligase II